MEEQEIWVVDLDSSPVAVSEDGSTTPISSEELAETTSDPVAEVPADTSSEDVSSDVPVEDTSFTETPAEESTEASTNTETSAEDPVVSDTEVTEEVQTDVTESTELVEDPAEDWMENEAFLMESDPVVRTFTVTNPDVLEVVQYSDVSPVMVEVVESILGEYQRMTYTVEEYDTDGNLLATSVEYVPGLAGLD